MMTGFIDIHCHLLPGLDDGPSGFETAASMLEMAAADGIAHIFTTPHFQPGGGAYSTNSKEKIISALSSFQSRLNTGVNLYYGSDVRISYDITSRIENGEAATLGGTEFFLLELTDHVLVPNVEGLVFNMRKRGLMPIITHPERYAYFLKDMAPLRLMRENGAMVQITALSVTGGFGRSARKLCMGMLEEGMVDFVATDAHNTKGRPPVLSAAYNEIKKEFGDKAAGKIFFENPKMILEKIASGPLKNNPS